MVRLPPSVLVAVGEGLVPVAGPDAQLASPGSAHTLMCPKSGKPGDVKSSIMVAEATKADATRVREVSRSFLISLFTPPKKIRLVDIRL
jgi:hypothetical protein